MSGTWKFAKHDDIALMLLVAGWRVDLRSEGKVYAVLATARNLVGTSAGHLVEFYVRYLSAAYTFAKHSRVEFSRVIIVARNTRRYVLAARDANLCLPVRDADLCLPVEPSDCILVLVAGMNSSPANVVFARRVLVAMRCADPFEYGISRSSDDSLKRGRFLNRLFSHSQN